jgi:ABC-type transport system substrate-binding protein
MKKSVWVIVAILMIVTTATVFAGGGAQGGGAQGKAAAVDPKTWKESDATESFIFHTEVNIVTLDRWTRSSNNTTRVISYLVFDSLVTVDDNFNYVPWLATSWQFSPDFKSIIFKLRDDVWFQNGVKFTADDVIYTFERIRDDTEHLPVSATRGWSDYLGALEKIGDYEFKMNFKEPMPEFWYMLSNPDNMIICKSAHQQMGDAAYFAHPIGTGPYKVVSFDGANGVCKMTIRTDEHGWWGYDAFNTYTNVKDITVAYSPEGQTRLASLRSGEVQMISSVPSADKVPLDKAGFTTYLLPARYVALLQTIAPAGFVMENQKLREALSLCIDRKLIVDSLLSGYGDPCNEIARNGIIGYTGQQKYAYDPDKAKKLVAESGYKGQPIRIISNISVSAIASELLQAIQSMGKEVGLNITINIVEEALFDTVRRNREADVALVQAADSGDMLYKPMAEFIGDDRFNTGFQNTHLRDLGKQLKIMMDPVKQKVIYDEMFNILYTELDPLMFLYWIRNISASAKNVSGVEWHSTQYPDLTRVKIVK